jgi:hypothetical protein
MRIFSAAIAIVGAVALSFAQAEAVLLPAGPEFSVITDDVDQGGAAVAHFADGRVVVAWAKASWSCCGSAPVVGRIYDANGVAAGPEFTLGTTVFANSSRILVRAVPGNRFVVVLNEGSPLGPVWRLYDDTGTPLGSVVTVPVASQSFGAGVAVDANGNIAIAYGDGLRLLLQRYTTGGALVGAATVVEDSTPSNGFRLLGLETASDGNLVVAWVRSTSNGSNGAPTGWIRRYDTSGAAVGSDFSFAGPHDDGWIYGQLASDGAGHVYTATNFIAGPISSEESGTALKRFALDGSGAMDLVLDNSAPNPDVHSMSGTPDGHLVVAWTSAQFTPYSGTHGWLTQFAADGSADGPTLPLTDRLYGNLVATSLSTTPGGSAVVAFTRIVSSTPVYSSWVDVQLQRFCDPTDAACALCPAFDDDVDTDGDLIPDGCDPCSNVASAQNAIVGKAQVNTGRDPRDRRASFDQTFVLPAGTTFGDLTIVADGARLRIESVRGQAMFDAKLPGGTYAGGGTRGWTATATKLKYSDRTDSPVEGVKRAQIIDQSNKQPGQVRVRASGGKGEYYTQNIHLPMTAIAVLGDGTAAAAGVCGEFPFAAEQCEALSLSAHRCIGRAE